MCIATKESLHLVYARPILCRISSTCVEEGPDDELSSFMRALLYWQMASSWLPQMMALSSFSISRGMDRPNNWKNDVKGPGIVAFCHPDWALCWLSAACYFDPPSGDWLTWALQRLQPWVCLLEIKVDLQNIYVSTTLKLRERLQNRSRKTIVESHLIERDISKICCHFLMSINESRRQPLHRNSYATCPVPV